jgi:hypothetical protein
MNGISMHAEISTPTETTQPSGTNSAGVLGLVDSNRKRQVQK